MFLLIIIQTLSRDEEEEYSMVVTEDVDRINNKVIGYHQE